ncbi:MAG: TatD family hydrolase [Clostridia bacterium]|nr:TatD family hydrolase [Clostridia bacterium]
MEKLRYFDTHSHYNDRRFDGQREELLSRLFAEDVTCIVGAATTTADAREHIALAEQYPNYYVAVGIHPGNIYEQLDESDLSGTLETLRKMLEHPKVVAIGEIGLDYYWEDNPPREMQKEWLHAQLTLAEETGYPVVIHDREAHGDVFDALTAHPNVRGVLHSCSCSPEMVKELVKRDWYVSFSGVITYKNAARAPEAVKITPADRILIETDCPYLSPVPMRGKTNHSGNLCYTAAKAAELRGEDVESFVRKTHANACKLFEIEDDYDHHL